MFHKKEVLKNFAKFAGNTCTGDFLKKSLFFFKLGFIPCKAEQPLQGRELQEKKHKKDYRI